MRILSVKLENFASYKELSFDFTNQGLTLIQGSTGAGKSTLCDIVPWGLFGITSKGGKVTDVLSWPADNVTKVTLYLENVTITRSRGLKPKDNDLMFWPIDGSVVRGSDMLDTQRLINNLLKIDADSYLAGAYFHEFSQTAQFFTAAAKARRSICEQLVDLSLASKLKVSTTEVRKTKQAKLNNITQDIRDVKYKLEHKKQAEKSEANRADSWECTKAFKISAQKAKILQFESNRETLIKELVNLCTADCKSDTCKECGSVKIKTEEDKTASARKYAALIDKEKSKENPYIEVLATIKNEVNPFSGELKDFTKEIKTLSNELDALEVESRRLVNDIEDLDLLQEVVDVYRSVSITNTIQELETQTNELLSKHFDAEIKVVFSVVDADKLEVTINKDDNECSFIQLSKGQRCMLKLCFGVSVMQCVANNLGVKFNQAFFDEALDGLDEQMKTKAYGLLSTLIDQYESIFVVEHSEELKSMFTNKFSVELLDGKSNICQV